jgi:hypothetical protein
MVALAQVSTGLDRRAAGEQRGRHRAAPNAPAGTAAAIVAGPRAVAAFQVLPGGREVLAVLSSGDVPPEIYRAPMEPRPGAGPMRDPVGHVTPTSVPPRAALRALTQLNAGWRGRVDLASPSHCASTPPTTPSSRAGFCVLRATARGCAIR